MRKWIVFGIVTLCAIFSALLVAVCRYESAPRMVYTCSGLVVDTSGSPVSNARVGIVTCVGEVCVSYSDLLGRWRIKGLPEHSIHIEHVASYFVTHPDYIGISWPKGEHIKKIVLERPVSLKVRFENFANLKRRPRVYAEIEEDYRAKLSTRYRVECIMPHPSPTRSPIEDGFEFYPLMEAPYKVTAHVGGQQPLIQNIDTRRHRELFF